ncbi:hypothetical protein PROFUN_02117 [Planoprotostelium fungivorum]|uniref:Uncharacterized protein n=1 Tax=Planoprotostelium fungivorum TaxID=1890364 RepID=A0A2P6NZ61_9EUKA|nr:hypothetical protein PROFUN_02117 [Planoprotostelium fungivorum]
MSNKESGIEGEPTEVPFSRLWPVMIAKIRRPQDFLPVHNVRYTDVRDENGVILYVDRYMSMNGSEEQIHEFIYEDEKGGAIRFVRQDTGDVVINAYHFDRKTIEYWLEDKEGRRIPWETPPGAVLNSIRATYQKAAE